MSTFSRPYCTKWHISRSELLSSPNLQFNASASKSIVNWEVDQVTRFKHLIKSQSQLQEKEGHWNCTCCINIWSLNSFKLLGIIRLKPVCKQVWLFNVQRERVQGDGKPVRPAHPLLQTWICFTTSVSRRHIQFFSQIDKNR